MGIKYWLNSVLGSIIRTFHIFNLRKDYKGGIIIPLLQMRRLRKVK